MSIEAMVWALKKAPVEEPVLALVLVALADNADDAGRNAWPSVATVAAKARCSERSVHRHLRVLKERGLIRFGDQQLVLHLPTNRRPIVYDLNMAASWGDTVSPQESLGVTESTSWGDSQGTSGVTAVADKPSLEPSLEPSTRETPKHARSADFEEWYRQYPKKVDPKAALRAYKTARKTATAAELLQGLERYTARLKADGTSRQFVKNPASWLNAGAWLDEPPVQHAPGQKTAWDPSTWSNSPEWDGDIA